MASTRRPRRQQGQLPRSSTWERYPARCDLHVLPRRRRHRHAVHPGPRRPQHRHERPVAVDVALADPPVAQLSVDADLRVHRGLVVPAPCDRQTSHVGITKIELLLPRQENNVSGTYHWDLYSESPYDYCQLPQPEDWRADGPRRTGSAPGSTAEVKILPRVTSTTALRCHPAGVLHVWHVVRAPTGLLRRTQRAGAVSDISSPLGRPSSHRLRLHDADGRWSKSAPRSRSTSRLASPASQVPPTRPEGGTPSRPAYDDWPPLDPQPDTLYLRLAP